MSVKEVVEVGQVETSKKIFQLCLFWLFDFDLIPKIENSEDENSEKDFEISELSEVSEFLICLFLDFLAKSPRFKFQFR